MKTEKITPPPADKAAPEAPEAEVTPEEVTPEPIVVTFDLPCLVSIVDRIAELDKAIEARLGTIGQIMTAAKVATLASPFGDASALLEDAPDSPTWEELVTYLDNVRAMVAEDLEAEIVKVAGSSQTGHKASVEAMRAERFTSAKLAHSLHFMLSTTKVEGVEGVTLPAIGDDPDAPAKVKSSRSGGGKSSANGSTPSNAVSVYKVKGDGSHYYYTKGSPLNLVALRVFDASVEDLHTALVGLNIDPSEPFGPVKVTLNDKIATIGGTVTQVPAS